MPPRHRGPYEPNPPASVGPPRRATGPPPGRHLGRLDGTRLRDFRRHAAPPHTKEKRWPPRDDAAHSAALLTPGMGRRCARGPVLDDVAHEPFAAAEIRRLEELRVGVVEPAIKQELAAGRAREVIGEQPPFGPHG